MKQKHVIPVVHHLDYETTIWQASLALQAGSDGIFIISHDGRDRELFGPAETLKQRFPEKKIGLNLLESRALVAVSRVRAAGLDMVWVDAPGVTSTMITPAAREISHLLTSSPGTIEFFGSVAFKYQPVDHDPAKAARQCSELGMIATTSGSLTGEAPLVSKIASMRDAIGPNAPLAIASGMTSENVCDYLPYTSHFLVATGISHDEFHFDLRKLQDFLRTVRNY